MARINLEDSIWRDYRFFELVKKSRSTDEAIGSLVRCWVIAQKFWFPNREHIPKDVWDRENLSNLIIECGLASIEQGSISVRGCSEQFQWLFDKQQGGKKSAEVRRQKHGSAQPRTAPNSVRTGPNSSEALSLSLSHKEYIYEKEFEEIARRYIELFPGTTVGDSALRRFKKQMTSEKKIQALNQALTNYSSYLSHPDNKWRKPRTSLQTFLGTERSGRPWIEFENMMPLKTASGAGDIGGLLDV